MIYVAIGLTLVAMVYDLKRREIPDWIGALLVVCAAAAIAARLTEVTWAGLGIGAALGLAVTLPLYALGGFGGGDVKLVVALGAALGPLALLSALFWVALSGGALATIAGIRGRRDLAYAPAIALGLVVYWIRLEFWHHASVL
ncbi:MAG TPA: prepilin peptidase [Planctomycetaceae bacterium]|nr:prepilin peptidase [Planctomycetaceae bacterium]